MQAILGPAIAVVGERRNRNADISFIVSKGFLGVLTTGVEEEIHNGYPS
jgi:hypothetical protein